MTYVLSHLFSLPVVGHSLDPPRTLRMVQGLTLLRTASGVDGLSALSLMYGFLTLMLLPTDTPSCVPAIESTSLRKSASMNNEWERWNMPPLHPSSCLPQVVWPTKLLHFIRGLLPAWPPNGINHMLQRCPGYAAVLSFPCYGQLYNASGVLVPALDTPPSPLLHQWTWLTLNWPLFKLI